eukprot:g577.t1
MRDEKLGNKMQEHADYNLRHNYNSVVEQQGSGHGGKRRRHKQHPEPPLVQVSKGDGIPVNDLKLRKPTVDYEIALIRGHQTMLADLSRLLRDETNSLLRKVAPPIPEKSIFDITPENEEAHEVEAPPGVPLKKVEKEKFAQTVREAIKKVRIATVENEKVLVKKLLPKTYPSYADKFDSRPVERLERRLESFAHGQEVWAKAGGSAKAEAGGSAKAGGKAKSENAEDAKAEERKRLEKQLYPDKKHLEIALRDIESLREMGNAGQTGLRAQIRLARLFRVGSQSGEPPDIHDQQTAVQTAGDFIKNTFRHQRQFELKRSRLTDAFDHFYTLLKRRLKDSDANREELGDKIDEELGKMERMSERVERSERAVLEDLKRVRQVATHAAKFL